MARRLDVSTADDQYRVVMEEDGSLYALRYGERWRDLTGDNLVYCLARELEDARAALRRIPKSD